MLQTVVPGVRSGRERRRRRGQWRHRRSRRWGGGGMRPMSRN